MQVEVVQWFSCAFPWYQRWLESERIRLFFEELSRWAMGKMPRGTCRSSKGSNVLCWEHHRPRLCFSWITVGAFSMKILRALRRDMHLKKKNNCIQAMESYENLNRTWTYEPLIQVVLAFSVSCFCFLTSSIYLRLARNWAFWKRVLWSLQTTCWSLEHPIFFGMCPRVLALTPNCWWCRNSAWDTRLGSFLWLIRVFFPEIGFGIVDEGDAVCLGSQKTELQGWPSRVPLTPPGAPRLGSFVPLLSEGVREARAELWLKIINKDHQHLIVPKTPRFFDLL